MISSVCVLRACGRAGGLQRSTACAYGVRVAPTAALAKEPDMANTTSLANVSKADALKKAATFKKQLMNLKEKYASSGEAIMETALTVGAGAGMGYVAAKFPGDWLGVNKEIWIGGGLLLLGLTGLGGEKMSGAAMSLGNGVLAAWSYNMVRDRAAGA
jgi:hypothetical protein